MEHYRPNGELSQGYYCMRCGMACGLTGHKQCSANPDLVAACAAANPHTNKKPHFKLDVK